MMNSCEVCGRRANLNWLGECWKCQQEIEEVLADDLGWQHERGGPGYQQKVFDKLLRNFSDRKSA